VQRELAICIGNLAEATLRITPEGDERFRNTLAGLLVDDGTGDGSRFGSGSRILF